MNRQPEPSNQEVLAGLIERVTYHNVENGFCVLRAKARGHRDIVTVVGHAAAIAAGEWITASGEWVNDRTHGQQFKARFLRTSPPTSADGIEKYLSSGMIRGVGPVYAKKLVRAFGEKVFDVIETTPDRLREVDGIGPVVVLVGQKKAVAIAVRNASGRRRWSKLAEWLWAASRGGAAYPYPTGPRP
jgi:exodeoxyribonuclease V alpha subunit